MPPISTPWWCSGEKLSSWLRGDLVNRLRKQTGLPVEHVEVAREEAAVT